MTTDLTSASDTLEYLLGQECSDTHILNTKDHLQMGIGCACAQENECGHQYSCIIAVSRDTEARDITERIPAY